jgi:hypothetical protein
MAVLYNQFCITDVISDLKTKTIVITTNFKVDAATINLNTVSLYDYSAGSGQLANYTIHVDGKNIFLTLGDYPAPGTRYYLKVTDIYDALNRKINYAYNDYIVFENDVITDVEILAPGFRETFTNNLITVKLKITNPLADGTYKIQISSDNAFFKVLSTVSYNATSSEILSSDEAVAITSNPTNESGVISFQATVDYNGQLYIRARAELADNEVGRWSEMGSFTIYNMPADPLDTTFLDNSITTFDLFPDAFDTAGTIEELEITNRSSITNITDRAFYIEFNKEIKLPEDYETDADGYVLLGTITGFRKRLK